MVKGPLTVTDMVCWHVGMGMGLYGVQPLRLGCREPPAHPALLPPRRAQSVPDVMQRVHWDPEFARNARATRPRSTTAACARRGSSTCAPTGWATTPGCGSSTASSASSTTSATRSGSRGTVDAQVPRRRRPARGRPRARGRRTSGARSPRPGHATDPAARAASTARCGCPTRPAAPPTCSSALDAIAAEFAAGYPRGPSHDRSPPTTDPSTARGATLDGGRLGVQDQPCPVRADA